MNENIIETKELVETEIEKVTGGGTRRLVGPSRGTKRLVGPGRRFPTKPPQQDEKTDGDGSVSGAGEW